MDKKGGKVLRLMLGLNQTIDRSQRKTVYIVYNVYNGNGMV